MCIGQLWWYEDSRNRANSTVKNKHWWLWYPILTFILIKYERLIAYQISCTRFGTYTCTRNIYWHSVAETCTGILVSGDWRRDGFAHERQQGIDWQKAWIRQMNWAKFAVLCLIKAKFVDDAYYIIKVVAWVIFRPQYAVLRYNIALLSVRVLWLWLPLENVAIFIFKMLECLLSLREASLLEIFW